MNSVNVRQVLSKTLTYHNLRSLFKCIRCSSSSPETVKLTTQWKANLDVEVEEPTSSNKKKPSNPGKMGVKRVHLPPKLHTAIMTMLGSTNHSLADMKNQSQQLLQYLASRKQPVENEEIQTGSREIHTRLNNERGDIESLPDEERDKEFKNRSEFVNKILRYNLYHWQPLEYNAYKGMVYLLGRMAPNYAVLYRVFDEISKRDPNFHPTTLFDFGSGVGSTSWAASEFWGNSLREYFNIDVSDDMNDIARVLLQGGKEGNETILKNVFYRQYLPASNVLKFNIVVSAFSLLELPSIESRLQAVDSLWQKTQDYLVIIEDGTNAGYQSVIEARDYVLECDLVKNCHVFAPCTHDQECPRFNDGTRTPCNFEVSYMPIQLTKGVDPVNHRFSYVVIQKQPRGEDDRGWPRIVRPVLKKGKHTICRLCTKDGRLTEITLTKSKHGTDLYQYARSSEWGDLFPIKDLKLEPKTKVARERKAQKDDDDLG